MKNEKARSVALAAIIALLILLAAYVVSCDVHADGADQSVSGEVSAAPEIVVAADVSEEISEERTVVLYDEAGFPVADKNTVMRIEVSLEECKTRLFFEIDGDWEQVLESDCIVGADASPTPIGEYRVINLDPGGFRKGGNYYRYTLVWYVPNGDYTQAYCFHTVAEDAVGNARDDIVSGHLSAGCVRLPHETCKWMCENVPVGTAVHIK